MEALEDIAKKIRMVSMTLVYAEGSGTLLLDEFRFRFKDN